MTNKVKNYFQFKEININDKNIILTSFRHFKHDKITFLCAR